MDNLDPTITLRNRSQAVLDRLDANPRVAKPGPHQPAPGVASIPPHHRPQHLPPIHNQPQRPLLHPEPWRRPIQKFYDDTWVGLRRVRKPFAWKGDTYKMSTHFLPKFGAMLLSDLGTDRGELLLLDWLTELRAHLSKRDDTPIAPRTVRNVASIVSVFFADAFERRADTKMSRNPTSCWDADRHLPAIEDKNHGWRMNAGFTLEQVVVLTTDLRIPEDRRVLYSLRILGGPRPGGDSEAANARWRDIDRLKKPLWRLTLEQSFNSPMRQEKSTKTHATLTFPIHPVVQKLLLAWEAEGWEKFMGRKPTSDDFMFPRVDGKQRLVSGTYKQFLVDLAAVGFPAQPQYESRSTFRNLLQRRPDRPRGILEVVLDLENLHPSARSESWVNADHSGPFDAFLGSGGRNAAMILSLR